MIVQVPYTCTVLVTVDTDNEFVERVNVIEEECEPGVFEQITGPDGQSAPKAIARRAAEIAEREMWPAWEFGL